MLEHVIWSEKYAPKKTDDVILPERLKKTFKSYERKKIFPDAILCGTPGIGKTTIAKTVLNKLGCSYIIINASLNGNIDTLRTDILQFASTVSFNGGRKYVILDEADGLTHATQTALRAFMNEYSKNCGFILTCNHKNSLIPAIHSRCPPIDFTIDSEESVSLAMEFLARMEHILSKENVSYDKRVVANVIQKFFPDWRRCINEMQKYSSQNGDKIDTGILASVSLKSFDELVSSMKSKNFNDMVKWVKNNLIDSKEFYSQFYENSSEYFKDHFIPVLVILLEKYQYQSAFAINQEINVLAFLTECMVEAEFK